MSVPSGTVILAPSLHLEMSVQNEFGGPVEAGQSEIHSYAEILDDPFLDESEKRQIRGEATLGHAALVLLQRGDQDCARLLLDVIEVVVERDDWDTNLWLEVAPEHMDQFDNTTVERIRDVCVEVSNRRGYGISWVGVREVLPDVGPQWRDDLRQQFNGKRPTNQARRVRNDSVRHVEDWLAFTNPES